MSPRPNGHAVGVDDLLQVLWRDREPVGQLAVAAENPARVQQNAPAGDQRGGRLDAGDLVTLAGHHIRRGAPVPGPAVVEDVTEPVPLGRALQWHEHHVVGAAEPVRETLIAARRVHAGVQHGVDRVGAPRQPVWGPFMSNDWARENETPRRMSRAPCTRLSSVRKFSVPWVSSEPQRPQLEHAAAAFAIACSGWAGSTRPLAAGWSWKCAGTAGFPPGEDDCLQCAPGRTIGGRPTCRCWI